MKLETFDNLTFSAAQLVEARRVARLTNRSVLAVLEESSGLAPDAFLTLLGAALHYPTLNMAALNKLEPAFDILSFAEALKHECVALRDVDGEVGVSAGRSFSARGATLGRGAGAGCSEMAPHSSCRPCRLLGAPRGKHARDGDARVYRG